MVNVFSCFYQFVSFSQSLFSNLTDAGSIFIIDTVNRNIKLMINFVMTVTHQLTSKENVIIYRIHVITFTAVLVSEW